MNGKSVVAGTLLYLALFAVSVVLVGLLPMGVFPWWYLLPVVLPILFGGSFFVSSLGKGSFRLLSFVMLGFYLVVAAFFSAMGGRMVWLVLGGICLLVWLVAVLGFLTEKGERAKHPSERARRIRIWATPVVVLALSLGSFLGEAGWTAYTGVRAARLTKPYLKCDADDLVATAVVPEFDVPIAEGTNLIWCAPFQLAWNELSGLVGEEIHFEGSEPGCVAHLNRRLVGAEYLDPASYVARAGAYTPEFIRELNADVSSRFGAGSFAPEALPEEGGPERVAAFGYLSMNLPFEIAFERRDYPLTFNGVPVKAFSETDRSKGQVRVSYPPDEGGFVVELLTRDGASFDFGDGVSRRDAGADG